MTVIIIQMYVVYLKLKTTLGACFQCKGMLQ